MKHSVFHKMACLFLVLFILLPFFGATAVATEQPAQGFRFKNTQRYAMRNGLAAEPHTFEATLRFPSDFSGNGGTIMGKSNGSVNETINFEVNENGNPSVIIVDKTSSQMKWMNAIFDKVNVFTGEVLHVAIVRESESSASCYINGELKQTLGVGITTGFTDFSDLWVGGDNHTNNKMYFKGELFDLSLYSDARTAMEIKSDYENVEVDQSELLAHWNMVLDGGEFKDVSANATHLYPVFHANFLPTKDPLEEYAFSFAVVGDIQSVTHYYPEKLQSLFDWILDNKEEKNTKFMFTLGDLTDRNLESEWKLVKDNLKRFDDQLPYSLVRGNHDGTQEYCAYFDYQEYVDKGLAVDSYDGTMLNYYQTFTVGTIKYMVLNLDIGPSDDVLDWAYAAIGSHPDHNVIVTTHAYLASTGVPLNETHGGRPTNYGGVNDGDDMWDKLFSRFENVVMILSGHDPSDNIVKYESKGENGNNVVQLLVDPQTTDKTYDGGVGMVAMLYFSDDGRQVQVEYYSVFQESFFKANNQFTFELDLIGDGRAGVLDDEPNQGGNQGGDQNDDQGGDQNDPQGGNQDNGNGNQNNTGNTPSTPTDGQAKEPDRSVAPIIIGVAAGVVVIGTGAFFAVRVVSRRKKRG